MTKAYYNENDPYAAQWLRSLIEAKLIAQGDVDDRSIVEIKPGDLAGYTQCHFFAGIAGWSLALRRAGWPDSREVWTGPCPCQPFSAAGRRKGYADERHLWPEFARLIAKCKPSVVFGEQVASRLGRAWLAGVRADLEALGYACGAADLCAAGVGAPHIRQRVFWVAEPASKSLGRPGQPRKVPSANAQGLADAGHEQAWRPTSPREAPEWRPLDHAARSGDDLARLGDATAAGLQGQWREYRPRGERHSGLVGLAIEAGVPEWNGPTVAVQCSDGPRRISAQPDAFPLAHGVPGRMGRLRAYGNAIVPQVAAQFIKAYK